MARAGDADQPQPWWRRTLVDAPAGIYLRFLAWAAVFMATAVTVQLGFVLREFEPHYLIVPCLLVLVIGLSLGRAEVLRARLREKSAQFRAVVDMAQELTYLRAPDGTFEYISPACHPLTGYHPEDFYADPGLLERLVHPEDRGLWRDHRHEVLSTDTSRPLDLRLVARDGRTVWVSHVCGTVHDDHGRAIGVRSTNMDITQRKAFEERIGEMAYHDPITGLYNRRALEGRLAERIAAAREAGTRFAVLFLDLDRFKHINDTLGHTVGDELLEVLGERLDQWRPQGSLVARFGGDELVAVIPDLDHAEAALAHARRLLATVEEPFHLQGRELYISGSIGIAFYPFDGEDGEALLRNADAAMFASKAGSQDNISLFRRELLQQASAFLDIETSLREAIDKGEFRVHYQPLVELGGGGLVGLEALARWERPGAGMIPPDKFIPVAEETGLIEALGEQILAEVGRTVARWQAAGMALPVAVNISGRQLARPNFDAVVDRIIRETGCDPGLLELEVTEEVFVEGGEAMIDHLARLKRTGVSVVIDDFGTGYSSLTYLKDLPFDKVKIDRAFIRNLAHHGRDRAILRAILALCRDLDLPTVIEGIETEDQLQLLRQLGAGVGQGFLFHRPQPAAQVEPLLPVSGQRGAR